MKINWKQTVYQPPKKKKITLRMEFNRSVIGFAFALTVLSLIITVPYLYIKLGIAVNNDLLLWNIVPLLLIAPLVLPQLLLASGSAINLNGALIRHELRKIKTLPRWLQLVTVMPVINNFLLPLAGWRIARRRRIFPVYILLLCSAVMSLAGWYNIFSGKILYFGVWGLLIAAAGLELMAHHWLWKIKYTVFCRVMTALTLIMWSAALIFMYSDTAEVKKEYASAVKRISAQGLPVNKNELLELYYANTQGDDFYHSAVEMYAHNTDTFKELTSAAGFMQSTPAEQEKLRKLCRTPLMQEFQNNVDKIAAKNVIQRYKLDNTAEFDGLWRQTFYGGFNSAAARSLSLRTWWAIQAGDRAEVMRLYGLFRTFNTRVICCDPLTVGTMIWCRCESIRLDTVKYMLESSLLTDDDRRRIAAELAQDERLIREQGIIGSGEDAAMTGEAHRLGQYLLEAFLRDNPRVLSPVNQKYIQWMKNAEPGRFALFRIFSNHICRIKSASMNYLAQCSEFIKEGTSAMPSFPARLQKDALWGVRDQKEYLEKVINLQKLNRELQKQSGGKMQPAAEKTAAGAE